MKNNKNLKLSLNKKTIATLDDDALKGVKGGEEEFLSMFNCSRSPSCQDRCSPSLFCKIVISISQ